jgi:hypothetical protein
VPVDDAQLILVVTDAELDVDGRAIFWSHEVWLDAQELGIPAPGHIMATQLLQEWPLIVMVTLGRSPPRSASTTSCGTSDRLIGLRRLYVGSELHPVCL